MRLEKSERLIDMMFALQGSANGLSLGDIAERYSVGRRTAERMRDALLRLSPAMQEIKHDDGIKRWRIPANAPLPHLRIEADDLAVIGKAVAIFRNENMDLDAERLDHLRNRLASVLPDADKRRIEPDLEIITTAEGIALRPGPRPKIDPSILRALRHALLAAREVRLLYRSRENARVSWHRLRPHGLLYGSRHYLVASAGKADPRLYAIGNILSIEDTDISFRRLQDFSLVQFTSKSFGVFQEKPFKTVWRFSAAVAEDALAFDFHPTQVVRRRRDGAVDVSLTAGGALEMCRHLFTWGPEVRIIRPKWLRDDYRKLVEELAEALKKFGNI